jgi:ribose transport system substrate-binding protein
MWNTIVRAIAVTALIMPLSIGTAGAQSKRTICFVTFSLQVKYFQSSVAGGKRGAEQAGVDLIVLDPQADASRQVTMFEDCLARNVNAIVVDPIESGSLMGVIGEAGKRKIPIAVLDTPVSSPYVVTQIGVPQFDASREFGQFVAGYIVGKMGGKANIGLMIASTEVQLARKDGFLKAMEAVPGAKVVATGDGRNILEKATSEAEDMLTRHPDIDVVYATGDPQLQGALAAGVSQNKKIAFFGWDDIPEPFIKPLEDGRIVGFVKQAPEIGGETAVKLLAQHLKGEKIPDRFTYNPTVVTKFNLDKYR